MTLTIDVPIERVHLYHVYVLGLVVHALKGAYGILVSKDLEKASIRINGEKVSSNQIWLGLIVSSLLWPALRLFDLIEKVGGRAFVFDAIARHARRAGGSFDMGCALTDEELDTIARAIEGATSGGDAVPSSPPKVLAELGRGLTDDEVDRVFDRMRIRPAPPIASFFVHALRQGRWTLLHEDLAPGPLRRVCLAPFECKPPGCSGVAPCPWWYSFAFSRVAPRLATPLHLTDREFEKFKKGYERAWCELQVELLSDRDVQEGRLEKFFPYAVLPVDPAAPLKDETS